MDPSVGYRMKTGVHSVEASRFSCTKEVSHPITNWQDHGHHLLGIKRRGKLTKGTLLLHDNSPVHKGRIAQAAMEDCVFEERNLPACIPDWPQCVLGNSI